MNHTIRKRLEKILTDNKSGSTEILLNLISLIKNNLHDIKTLSNKKKYIPVMQNKNELWNYKHKLLQRTNYYFEVVEKKLVTKIITD